MGMQVCLQKYENPRRKAVPEGGQDGSTGSPQVEWT